MRICISVIGYLTSVCLPIRALEKISGYARTYWNILEYIFIREIYSQFIEKCVYLGDSLNYSAVACMRVSLQGGCEG